MSDPVRRYALLLSALFAGFAALLVVYQQTFWLDFRIVPFGLASLLAACLLAWLAATLVAHRWPLPDDHLCIRFLTVALFAVLTVCVLVYGLAFLSNSLWGDLIDYDIAAAALPLLATFFRFDFLDAGQRPLAQASVASVLLLVVLLLAWFSRSLASSAVWSARRWLDEHPRQRPTTLTWSATAILAAMLGCCVWIAGQGSLAGEPLTGFIKISGATSNIELDATRIAALAADDASLAAYPFGRPFEKKNVILIFADSMRPDHMGVYGYARPTTPFLSSLQDQGRLHRVDMALSTCSESVCGISSTFASHPLSEISLGSLKLSTLLRREGYRIRYYLSGDHMTWRFLKDFYGEDVDELHALSPYEKDILDDRNITDALAALPPADWGPHFFYFFLMSSHIAGTRLPEYARYQPDTIALQGPDGFLRSKRSTQVSDALLTTLTNRHDNGVRQADAVIERIFRMLDERGYLQNSLVVILSDHGEGLGEHGNVGHTYFLYQEHIRIPLLIWDDEPERYRNAVFATQIDVAPTILDRLGLPVPDAWRGRSLLLDPPAERMTLHQTLRRDHRCSAIVRRSGTGAQPRLMKYIRCVGATEEVYDLVADPFERKNLAGSIDSDTLQVFRDAVKGSLPGQAPE